MVLQEDNKKKTPHEKTKMKSPRTRYTIWICLMLLFIIGVSVYTNHYNEKDEGESKPETQSLSDDKVYGKKPPTIFIASENPNSNVDMKIGEYVWGDKTKNFTPDASNVTIAHSFSSTSPLLFLNIDPLSKDYDMSNVHISLRAKKKWTGDWETLTEVNSEKLQRNTFMAPEDDGDYILEAVVDYGRSHFVTHYARLSYHYED